MTSVNYGINPAPIGPPGISSRSSSTASSAASAAATAAQSHALGSIPNNTNGNTNGNSNTNNSNSLGHSTLSSTPSMPNSPPNGNALSGSLSASTASGMPNSMAASFGSNGSIDLNAANGVNGLGGLVSSLQIHSVLVRRLAIGHNNKALSHITAYCNHGLIHAEIIDPEHSKDVGYMGAILQYDSEQCASMAIEKLNGMRNISFDAKMSAEHLGVDKSPFATTGSFSSSTGSLPSGMSRAVQGPPLLSQPAGPFTNSTFQLGMSAAIRQGLSDAGLDRPAIMQEAFSRPRPIGNHLSDRGVRTSSLDLINSGSGNDDPLELPFGSLSLNDNSSLDTAPTSMAEPPRPQLANQRRSTMPQIPTMHNLSSLRLDTANIDPVSGMQSSVPSGYPTPFSGQSPAPFSAHPSHSAHSAHPMGPMSAGGLNGNSSFHPPHSRRGPHNHQSHGRHMVPHANPSDQHPPCNTLYVGNIPLDAHESELKALFMTQRGFKRLSLRTRNNNTMCFVEFEDITTSTKALDELYGRPLSNSNHRGGMRLSYSKNPFGVRSEHNPNNRVNPANNMHGMSPAMFGHSQAAGAGPMGGAPAPPPGLPLPPSINAARPRRSDGLGAAPGSQIPASAYAQVSPWNQPQQTQQAQQSYGLPLSQSFQSYEDDEDDFAAGGSASRLNSSSNPLGDYNFQGNGASSAFSPSTGYNPSFGATANINANTNGVPGGMFGATRNPSLNGTNINSNLGMAYTGEATNRANYSGNVTLGAQSHLSYMAYN
ncbi:rna binding protein [Ophiostoma piceae UAMH 11346]|uniref:Rna binding protein n=1 Tax=Ophiostoma piceae (strain UAMH 11346) TaxID=1262450 RepID=S3C8U9_OPHP1|nr:rna binding protein [Ophiostoma piceae UAMH 11346]